jgi:hypothetical protein
MSAFGGIADIAVSERRICFFQIGRPFDDGTDRSVGAVFCGLKWVRVEEIVRRSYSHRIGQVAPRDCYVRFVA